MCGGLVWAGAVAASSITIDGQTATSVSAGSGGSVMVKIAPKNAKGHSRNTYKRFDVPKAGAVFDNSTAQAGLILNEVTGGAASTLAGPVDIKGPKADFVLANPNGITVNGVVFRHAGRNLLTTGARNGTDAAGLPRYTLRGGQITVTGAGGATTGGELHLYAPGIRADAALDTRGGALELNAGRGSLSVGRTGLLGWLGFTQSGADGAIEIAAGARLSGGSIRMIAEGGHSGVRMAGAGLATAGNFQITADGKVVLTGNQRAKKTLFVTSKRDGIDVRGRAGAQVSLSSDSEAVQLITDAGIDLSEASLSGAGRGFFGFATNAAISLRAGKGIKAEALGFESGSSDIELISEAGITGQKLRFAAAKDIEIAAAGAVTLTDIIGQAAERIRLESEKADLALTTTTLTSRLGTRLKGANVTLASSATRRSVIKATEGGVSVTASGNVENRGALVEGVRKSEGDAASEGGVTVTAGGRIGNRSVSQSSLGSLFATAGPLVLKAGGDIENLSGRLLSETTARLAAGGNLVNGVLETGETHAGLVLTRDAAHFGEYAIGREVGQIVTTGDLTIRAEGRVDNLGGEIAGAAVSITAADILNRPERFGRQSYTRRCILFFCRRSGQENIRHDGGTVAASEILTLGATGAITNIGGTLTGAKGMMLKAPDVRLQELTFYQSFIRPTGLVGWFQGRTAVRFVTFQPGTVGVGEGRLGFETETPVFTRATTFNTPAAPAAPKGLTRAEIDAFLILRNKRRIGLFQAIARTRSR